MKKGVKRKGRSKSSKKIDEKHPQIKKKIDKTLDLSVKEGATASAALSTGESYFPAFALALNATASQVGILHAIISLLPGVVQLWSSKLLEYYSRKKIIILMMALRVVMWIPIILCAYLFYSGYEYTIWLLIGLVGIYYAFLGTSQMTFFSWIGLLVPEEIRGEYFSKRRRWMAFGGLIGMIGSAIFLDLLKARGTHFGYTLEYTLFGFGIIFLISMALRFATIDLFKKQYEPRVHVRKRDEIKFKDLMKDLTKTPFGKFVLYKGFLMMAVSVASPFWAVYMLRELGFSYFWFSTIMIIPTAFYMIFLPLLGKMSDKFGNIKVFNICVGLMFLIPFAWVISPVLGNGIMLKIYLLVIQGALSGFCWAGYYLTTSNFILDALGKRKSGFGLGYMTLFVGVGAAIGSLAGAGLALIEITFMNPILFIILISGILRLIVFVFGHKHLTEVRHVDKFSSHYIVKEFAPVHALVREFHHVEDVVKRVEHFVEDE